MKATLLLYALLLTGSLATPVLGQEPDAFVPSPGVLRVLAGAEYTAFDSRFLDGKRVPLAASLTRNDLFPLQPLRAELSRFFTETGGLGVDVDPASVSLGTPDLDLSAAIRSVPLGLEVGILPGVSVGVRASVFRENVAVPRFALAGGTVGLNPDFARNQEILSALSEEWAGLGGAVVLPTDSSTLGRALQERVRELTGGQELTLPDSALTVSAFNALLSGELGAAPIQSELRPWRLGDATVNARIQLIDDLSGPYPTDDDAVALRAAVDLGARLPTGTAPNPLRWFSYAPATGHTQLLAGLIGDLFWGERFWATLSARYAHSFAAEAERFAIPEQLSFTTTEPLQTVRWTPGSELAVRVVPRFRLTEEIALGLQYAVLRVGEDRYEGEAPPMAALSSHTAQIIGGRVRFSTLSAVAAEESDIPFEVTLSYQTPVTGSGGLPASGTVLAEVSVFPRLWGREP